MTEIASKKRSAESSISDEDVDDVETNISQNEASGSTSKPKPKTSVKKTKKAKVVRSPGIVYISRIPRGMTPPKIRHLMERWGDVGRLSAQRRDGEYANYPP
jgi:ESF2/ABP1 family protein